MFVVSSVLNAFRRPTVSTITANLSLMVERLDDHSDAQEEWARDIQQEMDRLKTERDQAIDEADRAVVVADNIRALVSS